MARTVPRAVMQKAHAFGEPGQAWLSSLDAAIADIEQQWNISVKEALAGGTSAFVARAASTCGNEEYVLKLPMPEIFGGVFEPEAAALTAADGKGYAKLLRYDLPKRAMLLEKLGKPLKDLGYSHEEEIRIICGTLQSSWAPVHNTLLSGSHETLQWFQKFIRPQWKELQQPCPEFVIDAAYDLLSRREHECSPNEFVLIHGDAHNGNILQAADRSFKFIDPDGIIFEKAYDLGVLMREWIDDLLPDPVVQGRARCRFLHEITGVETNAIWAWGLIQSVSTALVLIQIGQSSAGKALLSVAEKWAAAE
ncbi:hypothetical protein FACS189476_00770 [Spirochaetia bacterium]|nr:hypothetical protein FACS189476_00770 [Spirochaetia bacterium]